MKKNLIFQRIKAGDKACFKLLFRRMYPELVVYAQKYTYDKSKSEDLVQDVFLYLWEHASDLTIHTSLDAYLYGMTRNRCIDYLRSVKLVDPSQCLEDMEDKAAFDHQVVREDASKEYNKLLGLIDAFPLRMQEIFRLKYFENYSYAEIADSMDISLNTVKTQLRRAKSKLKDTL